MDVPFLQSINGHWQQLKKWTLQKVTGAPEDSVEGGVWYNETSKRIEVDIGSENKEVAYVGEYAEHNSLLDKDGGDTINNYYGHVKQIHNNILDNFGKASGAIVSDSNNFIPIEQIPIGLLGGLTPKGAWNPSTNTPSLSNPPLATTRGWFYIASTSGTALGTDWASGDWCISDGTVWQKIDNTDKVSSVFGRTGSVVAASGDYNLDQINDGTTYKRITVTEKAQYAAAYTHSQAAHAPANADNTQATLNAGASKTTPVDADTLAMLDSAASNSINKLTWANVKATLKAYFDGLYFSIRSGITPTIDWNTVTSPGSFRAYSNVPYLALYNQPVGAYNFGQLRVYNGEDGQIYQEYTPNRNDGTSASRVYRRIKYSTAVGWSDWISNAGSWELANYSGITHASRHASGGADPVSIGLSQIANMSAFMRLVNDDATAADARATLGAAAASHTHTTAQLTGLDTALAGKLSTSAGSVHAEGTYRSTAPSLAVGDAQYGLSAQSGYLNLFAQAGVAKLYSKSGGTDATFVGDLATQQWTNTQLGGKSDKFSSGGKHYGAENVAFWRGIVMLNFATHWNGGGAHVRVIDRHGTYDVYLRGEGGETTAAVDRFHVMHSSLTPPIFKARIDGQKVYLYKQDSGAFIDTSILGAETKGNVTVAPFDYSSTTDPGGFGQFGACSYESLKYCNNVTSDIQAQLDGKAPSSHTHGNLSSEGKLGTTANLPIQTGTGGVIQAGAWYASNPAMNGTASAGSSNSPARGDHRHPTDTSRLAIGSGLSAGASVVVRAYNSGNSYSSNVIYLEY